MSDERERDQYGRATYAYNEIPPATEHYAFWRKRLTSGYDAGDPGATHTPSRNHELLCVGGWIPSGEWWLHCGVCRPIRETVKCALSEPPKGHNE